MPRAVQLTRNRPNVERRVYVKNDRVPEMGTGNPPSPLKGGGGGYPLSRRRSREFEDQIPDPVSNLDIGNLSRDEKQALLDRLALSLLDTDQTRDVGMWALAVSRALEAALGAGGASAYGPTLAKAICGASKVFAPVASFIREAGLDALHMVERQAALNYLARLVVADADAFARYTKQPLGLKVVSTRQANVRGVFEQAFPTYLASGLAKIVFRRMATASDWDGDRGVAS